MRLIDALNKNIDGKIENIGSVSEIGEISPGYVDESIMIEIFGEYLEKEVPLSETDFMSLCNCVEGNWVLFWQRLRNEGLI